MSVSGERVAVIYFGMPAHIVSGLVACRYGIVFEWPPGSVCVCVCSGWMEAMPLIGSEYMLKCIFVCLCFAVSRSYVHVPGPMYVHVCIRVYMVCDAKKSRHLLFFVIFFLNAPYCNFNTRE